ncbi:MAG: hypothetical protein QXS62_04185 [Sulfolobales archaeon]
MEVVYSNEPNLLPYLYAVLIALAVSGAILLAYTIGLRSYGDHE